MGLSNYLPTSAIARPGVCTSSTRPASPYEGQVIYTTDTDLLQIWNGTAWRTLAFATPTNGSVIQVVSSTYSTLVLNSTTTYADTGLTATITPTSTTSKILVTVHHGGTGKTTGNAASHVYLRLLRGGTELCLFEGAGGYTNASGDNYVGSMSTTYLDNPATTSATTYKTQLRNNVAAYAAFTSSNSSVATITLMEIAA